MPQYIFFYVGGEYPQDPAAADRHNAEYHSWLRDLGDAVVSPAIPLKDATTVHPDQRSEEGSVTAISGMAIMRFPSMDEALAAAKECPFLSINGTLEVTEMVDMSKAVN